MHGSGMASVCLVRLKEAVLRRVAIIIRHKVRNVVIWMGRRERKKAC